MSNFEATSMRKFEAVRNLTCTCIWWSYSFKAAMMPGFFE